MIHTEHKLQPYGDHRNDPNYDVRSNLSPYLHFGQISAQRVVMQVKGCGQPYSEGMDRFLEQVIVRMQVAENLCYCEYLCNLYSVCVVVLRPLVVLHNCLVLF